MQPACALARDAKAIAVAPRLLYDYTINCFVNAGEAHRQPYPSEIETMNNASINGLRSIELAVHDLKTSAEFYRKVWALEDVAGGHPRFAVGDLVAAGVIAVVQLA